MYKMATYICPLILDHASRYVAGLPYQNLAFPTLQVLAIFHLAQDTFGFIIDHLPTQDGISGPIADIDPFKRRIIDLVMEHCLRDRASTGLAWMPDDQICIIPRRNTALLPIQTIQLGSICRSQLHKPRQTQLRLLRLLTRLRLPKQQRHPRLNSRQPIRNL
ncbi:hypothetical protein AC578_9618 [Pseudocercospora eumusae]|uniref:Uncharacterized protein n=1 Tax=Pseudocercospora eumusae TaxID=321146 RepID=A0A139H4M2_9PEZI|nr:hypothetical protein AC578_9618 [Pseudocercospora eumusae]